MITTTKTSIESIANSIDTSQLYKAEEKKTAHKNEDFQKVLSSKTNFSNEEDTQKVDDAHNSDVLAKATENKEVENVKDTNDTGNVDELKKKLEELEDDSKSASEDKTGDILSELLALLSKLGVNEEDLKVDGKINTDMLKNILDGINNGKSSNNNSNSIMEKIVELLKNDSVKDKLDVDSLKVMEKLLSNLSSSLADDNTEATKNIKSLMSEVSNLLNNKQGQGEKVLTLEDMLNKNYSQGNNDSGAESDSNNTSASKDNKVVSKEDKFLNSLVDDDKDSSLNKINLFASRNTVIQNQGANATTRGLTINKATLVQDFIKDVKFMSNNGIKELTVKVNPGNLGEITINLVQEDGLMKANLKANSKETTALLSQNLAEIKKQLSEQNIKVSDVNIELYQDDTTFFKEQGFGGQLAGEQNRQNSSSGNTVSTNQAVSNEGLDENLAQENNNLSFLA